MKANFALFLSFDGIRLLHRAAGGWRPVGEADLDGADLPSALADLRAQAEHLEPQDLTSKLIIPDTQIKYLTLQTGALDTQARIEAARVALDGATPYDVSDLVFDIAPEDGLTHVAAVARETLEEAESFAVQFGFNPLCWVAVPGDASFIGEPFFGETKHAKTLLSPGERVEADGIAVVQIGPISDIKTPTAPLEVRNDQHALAISEVGEQNLEAKRRDRDETSLEPSGQHSADPRDSADVPDEIPMPGFSSRRTVRLEDPPPTAPRLAGATRPDGPSRVLQAYDIPASSIPDARISVTDDSARPSDPLPASPAEVEDAGALDTVTQAAADSLRKHPQKLGAEPKTRAPLFKRFFAFDRGASTSKVSKKASDVAAAKAAHASEQERLTVFGERAKISSPDVGGKPRYLGLALTAVLLIFLAGVAAWAALYGDNRVARYFAPAIDERPITADERAPEPEPIGDATSEGGAELQAALDLDVDAFLEAAPAPQILQAQEAPVLTQQEAVRALYAATGIWTQAPTTAPPPRLVPLDNLYQPSLDPEIPSLDAVALPDVQTQTGDASRPFVSSPAPFGTTYDFDARGLVIPTPDGALSPDGVRVFSGPPPVVQPLRPERQAIPEDEASLATDPSLAAARPRTRPDTLLENAERGNFGGLSRAELAALAPRTRPTSEKEALEADETQTANAPSQSLRPDTRSAGFAAAVELARAARPSAPDARDPSAAAADETAGQTQVAPRTVSPSIPTRASVAEQATIENALNLRRLNLMGVYGKASDRSALVRLANGRYREVQVGDRLDGGRVSAIGESELRYQKNGRNISLKMPRS